MYIQKQENTTHEQGETSAKEEHCVHIERIGPLGSINADEMKQAAKAEEDAGDQGGYAYCSVHRLGMLQ